MQPRNQKRATQLYLENRMEFSNIKEKLSLTEATICMYLAVSSHVTIRLDSMPELSLQSQQTGFIFTPRLLICSNINSKTSTFITKLFVEPYE